jgi:hypothetical protein
MAVMVFVTTIGGRMHYAFTYHEPLLSAYSVAAYADAVLGSLQAAVH